MFSKSPMRLRGKKNIRSQISEVSLTVRDLMYPIFVIHGNNIKREIYGLPGQYQWSIDKLPHLIDKIKSKNILSIMLFGIPKVKNCNAEESYSEQGIVQKAIRLIKSLHPELIIVTDVCLCAYKPDGHCGYIDNNGYINLKKTLDKLGKIALSHAESGADIVAPSAMMDNMVWAIRRILDENSFHHIPIMPYTVKYKSSLYGPFRNAMNSMPIKQDRSNHQMDYCNSKESIRVAQLSEKEGADFLMVKPALSYLDIIRDVSRVVNIPTVAYQVSGEYAMIKAASEKNWINETETTIELLTSIKRAGAQIIITYSALEISNSLSNIKY